jgi:tRNA A-37 threonylcarbamoyl transferase component Bud32
MTFPPAGWSDADAAGTRWWVAPGLRAALLGPDGLRLEEWLADGRACVIKHGPHRAVYRVDLGGEVVYIKHNRLPDVRAWLRQLVRPSKARLEFDRAVAVAARGVATVEPLALGERHALFGAGESLIVTRALDDTQTLNTFLVRTLLPLPPGRRARLRQRLARALGGLLARLHQSGICHNDLHAGNVLVRLTGDDEPTLFLIDLNAVSVSGPLDRSARLANLVVFMRWFVPRTSRADRLRFWRTYYEASGLGAWPPDVRGPRDHFALARELERRAMASTLAFWKHRDARTLAHNRYFRRVRAPGVRGHAVAELDRATLAPLLADPDAPFRAAGVRLLKDSRSSTVAELELSAPDGVRRVIYKRFRVTSWSDPWTALVRRSPALRSWQLGHGLRERCLPTARPLLMLHRVRRGMCHEGYLLTEKIEGATDLHAFVAGLEQLGPTERPRRRHWCIDAVARAVRQLHRCRLSHRDLKAANVLLTTDEDGEAPYRPIPPGPAQAPLSSLLPLPASAVWFIDLVGVRLHAQLSRARRVQNLARLNASFHQSPALTRTDRLRFLRAYLAWNLHGQGAWKRWWRAVAAATAAKAARNERSGRVLA